MTESTLRKDLSEFLRIVSDFLLGFTLIVRLASASVSPVTGAFHLSDVLNGTHHVFTVRLVDPELTILFDEVRDLVHQLCGSGAYGRKI
jgi:hypothetical protein